MNRYNGLNCQSDINECASNPCSNGTCADEPNSYSCTCDAGYTGEHCDLDIDECDDASDHCSPQSGCLNSPGSYSCVCPIGFEGADCSDDVNECERHGCHSNGECTNYYGSYTCVCVCLGMTSSMTAHHSLDPAATTTAMKASCLMALPLQCLRWVA